MMALSQTYTDFLRPRREPENTQATYAYFRVLGIFVAKVVLSETYWELQNAVRTEVQESWYLAS